MVRRVELVPFPFVLVVPVQVGVLREAQDVGQDLDRNVVVVDFAEVRDLRGVSDQLVEVVARVRCCGRCLQPPEVWGCSYQFGVHRSESRIGVCEFPPGVLFGLGRNDAPARRAVEQAWDPLRDQGGMRG